MAASLVMLEIDATTGAVKFIPKFAADDMPVSGAKLEEFLGYGEGFYYKLENYENNQIWIRCFKAKHDGGGNLIPGRWYIEFGEPCA